MVLILVLGIGAPLAIKAVTGSWLYELSPLYTMEQGATISMVSRGGFVTTDHWARVGGYNTINVPRDSSTFDYYRKSWQFGDVKGWGFGPDIGYPYGGRGPEYVYMCASVEVSQPDPTATFKWKPATAIPLLGDWTELGLCEIVDSLTVVDTSSLNRYIQDFMKMSPTEFQLGPLKGKTTLIGTVVVPVKFKWWFEGYERDWAGEYKVSSDSGPATLQVGITIKLSPKMLTQYEKLVPLENCKLTVLGVGPETMMVNEFFNTGALSFSKEIESSLWGKLFERMKGYLFYIRVIKPTGFEVIIPEKSILPGIGPEYPDLLNMTITAPGCAYIYAKLSYVLHPVLSPEPGAAGATDAVAITIDTGLRTVAGEVALSSEGAEYDVDIPITFAAVYEYEVGIGPVPTTIDNLFGGLQVGFENLMTGMTKAWNDAVGGFKIDNSMIQTYITDFQRMAAENPYIQFDGPSDTLVGIQMPRLPQPPSEITTFAYETPPVFQNLNRLLSAVPEVPLETAILRDIGFALLILVPIALAVFWFMRPRR